MAYATVDDLIARRDINTLGQLVNDDKTQANQASLEGSAVVAAALLDASGYVDAACLPAGRYLSSDLMALTGNSANLLKRLTCDIAFTLLRRRRNYQAEELPEYKDALDTLERLRKGELIFGVQAVVDAGNPQVDVLNAAIQAQQGIVSSIASSRYLPSRQYPS